MIWAIENKDGKPRFHRIYDMHHGAICTVKRKGVVYLDWLAAFAAGRFEHANAAW